MRIGHGYDVHKLVDGRRCIIGGVDIPYTKGLLGHSDADVLTHAVMDSLLGALALGDIGKLFPDSDEKYKGADSLFLASLVSELVRKNGCYIVNIDSIIIAQEPKLSPYIGDMRQRLSNALDINVQSISIKATTEEGLGFTGDKLGIAAHAICLIDQL